jgi:hypothetical protein
MALRRSLRHVPWSIEKAIQGEHFLRYTVDDVLPRLSRALADVRAERSTAGVAPGEAAARGARLDHADAPSVPSSYGPRLGADSLK